MVFSWRLIFFASGEVMCYEGRGVQGKGSFVINSILLLV